MDGWATLGIEETASMAEARRAFLRRAQVLHPDRHQGAAPDVRAEADRLMRELNAAWAAVSSAIGARAAGPGNDETRDPHGENRSRTNWESDFHGDGADPSHSGADTSENCLDWYVGTLQEADAREVVLDQSEWRMLLTAPGARFLARRGADARVIAEKVLELLTRAARWDLASGVETVRCPGGLTLPVEYWSRYQVLEDDPTQDSLLVFLLDEIMGGNEA